MPQLPSDKQRAGDGARASRRSAPSAMTTQADSDHRKIDQPQATPKPDANSVKHDAIYGDRLGGGFRY